MSKRLDNLKELTKINNLCKIALNAGGEVKHLMIPHNELKGDGLTNGTILYNSSTKKWLLNLRRVKYALFHCENNQKYHSPWGPLIYFNPEDDVTLKTINYICELDNEKLTINSWCRTNTSKLDKPPIWGFVGHEDVRLVYWDGILYQTGVRRDTTINGEGRMELSTVKIIDNDWKEINRQRISTPDGKTNKQGGNYCEKNWMPINDMPYHYVKWSNPTEIIKVDPKTGSSEVIIFKENPGLKTPRDMRGSSNVIKYKDMWVAIIHECDLWYDIDGKKDAVYHHRIVCWDKDWNIIKMSDTFNFMTGQIEFTCGLALDGDNFLIPFGFQDNTSYILKLPSVVFDFLIGLIDKLPTIKKIKVKNDITNFINNPYDAYLTFKLAEYFFSKKQFSSALGLYSRSAEYSDDYDINYQSLYMMASCISSLEKRDKAEELMWLKVINFDKDRPEGYLALSRYYSWRNYPNKAYYFANMGINCTKHNFKITPNSNYSYKDLDQQRILYSNSDGKYDERKQLLKILMKDNPSKWVVSLAEKWKLI